MIKEIIEELKTLEDIKTKIYNIDNNLFTSPIFTYKKRGDNLIIKMTITNVDANNINEAEKIFKKYIDKIKKYFKIKKESKINVNKIDDYVFYNKNIYIDINEIENY